MASVLARTEDGALPLVLLIAVHERSNSFAEAGLSVAMYGFGAAILSPAQARLADRFGHRRVLPTVTVLHLAGIAGLAMAAPVAGAASFLAGAAHPQVSGIMRSGWIRAVADADDRSFAIGVEALTLELVFLVGPALVSAALIPWSPWAAMFGFVAVGAAGSVLLAFSLPVTRVSASRAVSSPLKSPGLRTLMAATMAFGVADGIVQVAVPAAAGAELAGLLLTLVGIGTVGGGAAYLRLADRDSARDFPAAHLAMATVLVGASALLKMAVPFAAVLFVLGLAAAPIAITNSRLLARVTDDDHATEAYTWLLVSVVIGGAIGNFSGGWMVEHAGIVLALGSAAVTVGLGGAIAGIRRASLAITPDEPR